MTFLEEKIEDGSPDFIFTFLRNNFLGMKTFGGTTPRCSDISVPDIISVSVSVQFRGNNFSCSSVSVLNIISVSVSVFNK